jgi:hypothetical protein
VCKIINKYYSVLCNFVEISFFLGFVEIELNLLDLFNFNR